MLGRPDVIPVQSGTILTRAGDGFARINLGGAPSGGDGRWTVPDDVRPLLEEIDLPPATGHGLDTEQLLLPTPGIGMCLTAADAAHGDPLASVLFVAATDLDTDVGRLCRIPGYRCPQRHRNSMAIAAQEWGVDRPAHCKPTRSVRLRLALADTLESLVGLIRGTSHGSQ